MAKQLEETLIGYGFVVRQVEVQVVGQDGQPLWNGTGEPKMEPQWILDFMETTPHVRHIIHVAFSQEARDKLVEALTGGITLASAIPKGGIEL